MIDSSLPIRLAEALPHGPHRMTVGLRPLALADWIEEGADFDDQLRERAALLREREDVLGARPGSQQAQRELLDVLLEHLREHFTERYCFSSPQRVRIKTSGQTFDLANRADSNDGALRTAAHLVPEDLCLLQRNPNGQYTLSAAALCFPTRWRLADKLGQPLLDIHSPVPGYADRVGEATDRVLTSLDAARALWRHNWTLLDSPALYQPERIEPQQPIKAGETGCAAAERLWFRCERQTLRRLPRTGAVLFTIRIRQCSLAELCQVPGAATRLLTQLQTMPAALKTYKGLDEFDVWLRTYLTATAK
ncbi:MAG: hypothetical protein ACI9DC_000211 [Gammaproteobacteria bacterium]